MNEPIEAQIVEQPSLALVQPPTHTQELPALMQLAKELVPSGFLPDHIKTPGQAVAIMLAGRELGIGPMLALRSIWMLKGKIELSADLQLSLFKRDGGQAVFKTLTDEQAVLWFKHPNGDEHTETFSIADARRANLVRPGGNWTTYPKAMLRSRVITAGLKSVGFEPKMSGCYAPGEIGGPEMVEIVSEPPSTPAQVGKVAPTPNAEAKDDVSKTIIFGEKEQTKFRNEAETWIKKERDAWVKANSTIAAWVYAVANGLILQTEQLSAVTWSKLFPLSDAIEAAIKAIRTGQPEAGAKRKLSVQLIERKEALTKAIGEVGIGDVERAAFQSAYGPPGASTEDAGPPPTLRVSEQPISNEWFWEVICPIPHKGEKKADYEKAPDSIGSLYDAAHGGNDAARKRLWGFAHNWKPEPRTVGGKTYQPSEADLKFRQALDDFLEWEEAKGEQGAEAMRDGVDEESDEVPF